MNYNGSTPLRLIMTIFFATMFAAIALTGIMLSPAESALLS